MNDETRAELAEFVQKLLAGEGVTKEEQLKILTLLAVIALKSSAALPLGDKDGQ